MYTNNLLNIFKYNCIPHGTLQMNISTVKLLNMIT